MVEATLQLGVPTVLLLLTVTGLYYNASGEEIPGIIKSAFYGLIALVLLMAYLSFAPKKDESDSDEELEKLLEEKRLKKKLKYKAKIEKEKQEEKELAEKKAAKQASLKQIKVAKKEEERKKQQETIEEKKVEAKVEKKKKKKKAKVSEESLKAEAVKDTVDGWVVQPLKKEVRAAKKASQGDVHLVSGSMLVNPRHYAAIIGAEGSTRKRLEETFAVTLTFPKKSDDANIKIEGSEIGVETVKKVINEIIDKGYSTTLDSDMSDLTIMVNNIGILLSNGGAHLKTIRAKTGARINLPKRATDEDKRKSTDKSVDKADVKDDMKSKNKKEEVEISLMGDQNAVKAAAIAIRQLVADGYSDLTHENYIKMQVETSH